MKLAILESPYAVSDGRSVEQNVAYAKRALRHAIELGYAPLASHLLYTQVLDDGVPKEREQGIVMGHAWIKRADALLVYEDHGISPGMLAGVVIAQALDIPVHYFTIGEAE